MERINYKEIIFDGCSLVFGLFFYAMCFNLFLTPNDLVVSGFSGIAIVMQKLFGWTPSVFLLISNIILLIICFIFLGWSTTKKNIIGSLLYPLMVTLSMPVANFLSSYLVTEDFYLTLLFAICLYGISSGFIYRSGFTAGGSDIIMQIINKYCKVSESKALLFANGFIILSGMLVFGFTKGVYSFIILYCSTYFVDKIMFGISDSKLFYIYTRKTRKIKKVILEEFQTGFTTIPGTGGYSHLIGYDHSSRVELASLLGKFLHSVVSGEAIHLVKVTMLLDDIQRLCTDTSRRTENTYLLFLHHYIIL